MVSGLAPIATSGSAADLSAGSLPAARMPALTGDVTNAAGSLATVVGKINGAAAAAIATSGSATDLIAGLIPLARISQVAKSISAPANQAAQINELMFGFAGAFTPSISGNALLIISGFYLCNTATISGTINGRYGTGAAPAHGDLVSGTIFGTISIASLARTAYSVYGIATGLTLATPIWIDLSITSNGVNTVNSLTTEITAIELR